MPQLTIYERLNALLPKLQDPRLHTDLKALEPELRHVNNDPELVKRVQSVKQILQMPDPTAKIPELPILLKPVQEKVQEALKSQIYQVQNKSKLVRDKVQDYVTSVYRDVSAKLDLSTITKDIDNLVSSVDLATNIDSAIARESELERIETSLLKKVDQQAAEILKSQAKTDSDDTSSLVKPVVSVQLAQFSPKSLLETSQDVEDYLEVLQAALLAEIQQNNWVRVE